MTSPPKNKTLLRQLESDRLRAKLYFLPEQLMGEVAKDLENGRVRFVEAQVAIAIDILLALPLRPQNLSSLSWRHHFSEPNGPRSQLLLHIAARETKTKRQDIVSEVPDEVARRLRWYRRHILPRLGADVNGHLFVTEKGSRKSQATLTVQIIDAIARHIGIHMTPHQFRHFGATSYLEEHPEDFETARSAPRSRLEQDHTHLCGLIEPASQPGIQPVPVQAARGPQADALEKEAAEVKTMRTLKHLPVNEWPEADREAFRAAYEPGDVFDETAGPGAHLAEGTRTAIKFAYRRWLGFLKANYPDDLSMAPAERITPERVRAFIEHLSAEIRPSSVAIAVAHLYAAARLIAPTTDWAWLRSIKSRLACLARPAGSIRSTCSPCAHARLRHRAYGRGAHAADQTVTSNARSSIATGCSWPCVSLWPIRRRSLAALTVSRHLEFDDAGVNILLYPSDTKAERAESFRVPEQLLPYLMRYLKEIRPVLLGRSEHDGFWASYQGRPLSAGRLYDIVRARSFRQVRKGHESS